MDEPPPLVAEIEGIIRRYLQAHPQAVDIERGIRWWWLRNAHRTYAARDVRAAIQGPGRNRRTGGAPAAGRPVHLRESRHAPSHNA